MVAFLHIRFEELILEKSRIIKIMISNPELISTLMVKEYPKCVDGLILEAPAFKLHEATAKWYIILGKKLLINHFEQVLSLFWIS